VLLKRKDLLLPGISALLSGQHTLCPDEPLKGCSTDLQKAGTKEGILKK
jgi:hypothetical protein